jgi:hypothetical protein
MGLEVEIEWAVDVPEPVEEPLRLPAQEPAPA